MMRLQAPIPQPAGRTQIHPQPQALGLAGTAAAAALLGALLVSFGGLSAVEAGPLCRTAMFQCVGPVASGINLRKAIGSKARARQVMKSCRPFYTSLEPDRCDWRRTLRVRRLAAPARQGGSGPQPPARQPPARQPGVPQGTAPAPRPTASRDVPRQAVPRRDVPRRDVPRRDVRGRYSTTPAPARIPTVTAQDRRPYAAEVRAAARRYKLPAHLLRAVMKVESGYNPTVVSHAGAMGLMQLLPTTAKAMGVQDPRDPGQSILGGARFLRILANRFRGDLVKVLSAYHAGSTRVKRRGGTPYAATDSYVRKVLGVYYALQDR